MDWCCDLEVDVNGEEVFVVDKSVLCSYSGKVSKFLNKSKEEKQLKVMFHDFPGGAANFEAMIRFCYNKGKCNINPFNVSNLTCAAPFMEIDNLCDQTEKSLHEVAFWTWSELLVALKQSQNLHSGIVSKLLDSVIGRISSSCDTSPCLSSSSPDRFRMSFDTKSTESVKNNNSFLTWWFEDLAAFDIPVIKILVKLMLSKNVDGRIISRFLFYYQKSSPSASRDEKSKIFEAVVEILCSLDIMRISYKSLFEMLSIGLHMKINKPCRKKLEIMVGSLLDRATLDNLLMPSPAKKHYQYDVNLVLTFLKSFLRKGVCCIPLIRMKKVVKLMDSYLAEIAPDPYLKPSKFLATIRALPDDVRDSFDGVYHAVYLYLQVHRSLSEEQKTRVCSGINYEKLSSEAIKHMTQNDHFLAKFVAQSLFLQQSKLKSLLDDEERTDEGCQQIVLYAKKFYHSNENEKLKTHLQGMHWRVAELETICRRMQMQMTRIMRSRLSSRDNDRSVAKFYSPY